MSGTFRIKLRLTIIDTPGFSAVPATDLWWGNDVNGNIITSDSQIPNVLSVTGNPSTNGSLVMQFNAATQATLHFDTNGSSIILDGDESNPLEFNGLPAGFTVISALVEAEYFNNSFDLNTYTIHLQKDASTESSPITAVHDAGTTITFPYVFSVGLPTMLNVVNNGCGLRLNSNGIQAPAGAQFIFALLDITGTYEIQLFQFQLENDSPVNVGDIVTITSSDASDALDLDQITSIIVQFTTAAGVFTTSAVPSFTVNGFTLTFPMINFGTSVQVTIYAFGTQFSGSVPLGSLYTINFTNGSGIYRIIADKTDDTLYANGTSQLVNAKIPNPLAKTAFFP